MGRVLTFYLLRQLAGAFAFATGAVTFVVLFAQSFRLLSLVVENAATLLVFFQLMGLSGLTVLPLIMPLGVGVAVLFVYHRLGTDSELTVMRAAGLNARQLIKPVLILAGVVTVLGFGLTLWVAPMANRMLADIQGAIRNSTAVFLSHPGSFNDLAEGLTFYADKRGANGSLQGILIQDAREPDRPVTTMAESGQVGVDKGQPNLVIFNGRRQELDPATGQVSELLFDQYVLDLESLRATHAARWPDPREQSLSELRHPSEALVHARGPLSRFVGEFHARLSAPLLSFAYGLIGVTAILVGSFRRRGMSGRVGLGAGAMLGLQAAFMTLTGAAAQDNTLIPLLYLISLFSGTASLALLNEDLAPDQSIRKPWSVRP